MSGERLCTQIVALRLPVLLVGTCDQPPITCMTDVTQS